jgi:hypothetical protein
MLSSEPDEDSKVVRRTALAEGLGVALNSILKSRSLLNPTGLAVSALNQYGEQLDRKEKEDLARKEAEMRAMVSQIQNLRATFEGGRLVVHVDKATVLELIENMLKKSLARQEAGMTATFKVEPGEGGEKDHDAELNLPSRTIYLKFVPEGRPLAEFAVSYLERARDVNPSEYWLLTPNEEVVDFPFEPIFTENKIARGRLRSYPLPGLLSELVGTDYDVVSTYDVYGGFKFVISSKPPAPPQDTKQ